MPFLNCHWTALMKKHALLLTVSAFFFIWAVSGCGTNPVATISAASATPTITSTPDPCAPENIGASVEKVHRHMREFDDASALAASMPANQLSTQIANLQQIRRDAEDEPIPSCLVTLKTDQINHMNTVINTLLAFMRGSDQQTIDQGITLARQQHDQYTLELARLLGITPMPATAAANPSLPPLPTLTPTP